MNQPPKNQSQSVSQAEKIGYGLRKASKFLVISTVTATVLLGLSELKDDPTMGSALLACGATGVFSTIALIQDEKSD